MARRPLQIKVQAFLANLPMFGEMHRDALDRIAAATVPIYMPKGNSLFQRGDPCTGFYVVVYGEVKTGFTSPQGIEKVVEIIRAGQAFGESPMFLDEPYVMFAQALADAMLLHIAKHPVFEELARDPRFARHMMSSLSRRLHGLIRDVEAYTLRSGQQRIIGYLLAEARHAAGSAGPIDIHLTSGKSVIASRLNMTPEHFSRILHELGDAGLIEIKGRDVRVPDLAKLQRAA